MLAFPEMLVPAAQQANIKVPTNVDEFDKDEFPHFFVFKLVQLGTPMRYPSIHWDNAVAIARIPEDKIRLVTPKDLEEYGVDLGGYSK